MLDRLRHDVGCGHFRRERGLYVALLIFGAALGGAAVALADDAATALLAGAVTAAV